MFLPSSEVSGLGNSTGLEGLNDVHLMGLVERPDHLDAKAIVHSEGHGVEDGAPGQHPSLVAMRVPGRQHLGV